MRNVTITLEEDLARWVRIKAAGNMKSLSRYIAELLAEQRRAEQGGAAESSPVRRFLDAMPAQDLGVTRFDREALYDRQVLRR